MNKKSLPGEIGLFFIIDDNLYSWGEPINEIHTINDFKATELSHFDYFYDLIDIFPELNKYKDFDYGYFPRGRVVYQVSKSLYTIYLDKCLLNNGKILNQIVSEFNLGNYQYQFLLDEHYKCANCSEEIKLNNEAMLHYIHNIKH